MLLVVALVFLAVTNSSEAADKPNILLIVSDDTGYGDLGPYGGGEGRGMPTPNIDRMAAEGMTFFSFYAQPSCTPGRAAILTGRIPNRSGMTTVAFQGQGGGLPKAEWTLGSVLKKAGYNTYFTGKWHLGEADYALPNAHGYDQMEHCFLYHCNAYTYGDESWFPDMDPELRAMFNKVTKGSLSGNAGEPAKEDWKVNGQYVDTPDKGVVGIPFMDKYVEQSGLKFLEEAAKDKDNPFFIHINFMKVHQPNLPAPEFEHKSLSKSKYADSLVELDTRIGNVMNKLRELGLDKNTLVFYTTDNGAWQDVYPDAGYTPLRGTKGTVREGGNRVPAIAIWPGKIKPGVRNHDILGGLDLMATFASVAGIELPTEDLEGQPMMFDSYDMTPVLTGTGKSKRKEWFYFTENELSPGAARVGNYKAVFNLRGDDGQETGGLAVDSNLGWKGADKYVATVPQVFDLWADPQERYDIFMNNFTERTWSMITISDAIEKLMKTYVEAKQAKSISDFSQKQLDYQQELVEYQRDLDAWKRSKSTEPPPWKPEEPVCIRYTTTDTTIEALAALLAVQFDGVLVERDELAGWLSGIAEYKGGKGSDLGHWLACWSAKSLTVDRKTGATKMLHVPRASVSLIGGIQPGVLRRAIAQEHLQDGLCARLLFAMPEPRRVVWTEATVHPEVEAEMGAVFDSLFGLEPAADEFGNNAPFPLDLTPEAKTSWVEYFDRHRGELLDLDDDLAAAWSKLEAYAARFALIFQLATDANSNVVDQVSMEAGIELSDWFGHEAKRIYGLFVEDAVDQERRELIEWIQRRGGRTAVRDLQMAVRRYRKSGEAEAALSSLVKAGVGRWDVTPTSRKPRTEFVLTSLSTPTVSSESAEILNNVDVDTVDTTKGVA